MKTYKHFTITHAFNAELAHIMGIDAAIVLNQLDYWIKKCGKKTNNTNGLWVYNTFEDWKKQFSYWSLSKIKRIFYSLEKAGILLSKKVYSHQWNQTKWYSVDYKKLYSLLGTSSIYNCQEEEKTKRNNALFQNEQMLLKEAKNNYTKKTSYRGKEEILEIKDYKKKTKVSKLKNYTPSQAQEDVAQQMVQIWNDHFECSLSPVKAFVNKNVLIQLDKILKTKFENNLDNWKLYARAVSSSKFLMGEKETKSNFKAQFLWLIKEETIDSIQNGAYGVGDRVLDSEKIEENLKVCKKEVQQMVQTKMTDKVAENISSETEEQEFKKYLLGREYRKDGDQYLVGKHMETIGSEFMHGGYITASHVFYPGNEKYKQRLFQSYLMKKYYGIDETGISSSFSKLANIADSKSMLLKFKHIREKLKFGTFQESNQNYSLLGCIAEKIAGISTVCLN